MNNDLTSLSLLLIAVSTAVGYLSYLILGIELPYKEKDDNEIT